MFLCSLHIKYHNSQSSKFTQEYYRVDVQEVSLTEQGAQSHHNFVGHKAMLHSNQCCLTLVLHSS